MGLEEGFVGQDRGQAADRPVPQEPRPGIDGSLRLDRHRAGAIAMGDLVALDSDVPQHLAPVSLVGLDQRVVDDAVLGRQLAVDDEIAPLKTLALLLRGLRQRLLEKAATLRLRDQEEGRVFHLARHARGDELLIDFREGFELLRRVLTAEAHAALVRRFAEDPRETEQRPRIGHRVLLEADPQRFDDAALRAPVRAVEQDEAVRPAALDEFREQLVDPILHRLLTVDHDTLVFGQTVEEAPPSNGAASEARDFVVAEVVEQIAQVGGTVASQGIGPLDEKLQVAPEGHHRVLGRKRGPRGLVQPLDRLLQVHVSLRKGGAARSERFPSSHHGALPSATLSARSRPSPQEIRLGGPAREPGPAPAVRRGRKIPA